MKIQILFTLTTIALLSLSCKQSSETKEAAGSETEVPAERILTLSGALTETVSLLGHEDEIVGVDVTSVFPESVKESATNLGHVSRITIETIMALKPSLIFAIEKELNPELLAQLKSAQIRVHFVEHGSTPDGAKRLIVEVADLLGVENPWDHVAQIDFSIDGITPLSTQPKIVFVYARGAGTLMVAGQGTPMQQLVDAAGGQYAITEFEGFKPLTPESLVQANPDALFLFESGLQSLGGIEGLLELPGVAETQAGKNRAVITMDGALASSFGPRVGQAVAELNKQLQKLIQ